MTELDADLPELADRFSFVLVSDRTGDARDGVFERGLAVTDLLAPSFAILLGDLVEGYTDDDAEVARQWDEVDAMLAGMRTPIVAVPGNHDASTPAAARGWRQRFGPTYRHFRYGDALFVLLDTQDPPREIDFDRVDWDGLQPATVSDEQLEAVEQALGEHADARWTFLAMHMPLWQGEHPAWARIRSALGRRPYHAFAGHVHNYQQRIVDHGTHIRLGPTGGCWVFAESDGNFDHVTQVTVGAATLGSTSEEAEPAAPGLTVGAPTLGSPSEEAEPAAPGLTVGAGEPVVVANIVLDGVRGPDGRLVEPLSPASPSGSALR